jgi:RHS repeat-associated protein
VQDKDLSLTYMQQRYYDPVIGRFYSNDPVGFTADNPMMFNRYAYGNNNPYKFVDPDGNNPVPLGDFRQQMINQYYTNKYQHAALAHQGETQVLPIANYVGKHSGDWATNVGYLPHPIAQGLSTALGLYSDFYESSIKNTSGKIAGDLTGAMANDILNNAGAENTKGGKGQLIVKNLIAHTVSQVTSAVVSKAQESTENSFKGIEIKEIRGRLDSKSNSFSNNAN